MNKFIIAVAAIGLSTTAFAQGTTFAEVDADASGTISYEEALVAWPALTAEAFAAADTDASGSFSMDEYDALVASMPAP